MLPSIMGGIGVTSATDAGDEEQSSIFERPPSIDTLPALQRLDQDSPLFRRALHVLADGGRDEDRRGAYGQTGLLDYLLEVQANCLNGRTPSLRAIANACADNGKAHYVLFKLFGSFVTHQTAIETA